MNSVVPEPSVVDRKHSVEIAGVARRTVGVQQFGQEIVGLKVEEKHDAEVKEIEHIAGLMFVV